VIEDAAQAHGAEYKGRRAGSLGDLAVFSFYPVKNLGAYGEGGMITTANPEYTRKLRLLRDWGAERKYHHVIQGYNYRMEGLQGAILRVKLRYLDQWTEARRAHAALYTQLLEGTGVIKPCVLPEVRHVYHVYSILVAERQSVTEHLRAQDIQFAIHYPIPIHLMKAHADLGYGHGDFPVAEDIAERVIALPIYPEMTEAQIETVSGAVCEAVAAKRASVG